jgi:gluconolactonase
MAEILRDAGLSELVESPAVECLASGFEFTEGPLWCPDGSLLFQDNKAEKTYRIDPGRSVRLVRDRTGAANGQTFGPDGSGVETLVETWAGRRLNSPNDVVCRSDGIVYFTDPPYGVAPAQRALHFQGVFSLDLGQGGPCENAPALLLDDFEKPNGLAFSPDERILYICDTARYHIRSFEVEPSGRLKVASGRVFARMDPVERGGPDGVKVDREGRVYAAVAQGIWVYEPDGRLLGILALPKRPANLAWCDRDARGLAITAVDSVYYVRLRVEGMMPSFLP